MTPTPAQIEAATKAMREDTSPQQSYDDLAKIALTAAAEVEEHDERYEAFAQSVHAEVGEPLQVDRYMTLGRMELRTIERCALVAENFRRDYAEKTFVEPRDIAAAIRALKEKP